ncbi:hypothetical protein HELRODRAFT_173134 [Helobdella robusta]|uniref:Uncharacterized protein n=1 Tax=Helobdella robusta TaxID=6412 RepID=T1F6F4_HELRO|nr:hypothetical protein HELRODRAFT_173134 [Helobdella robusta]ESO04060.1 hypothetical protein HELRODRAFT_173134 [Helobdella robusta]
MVIHVDLIEWNANIERTKSTVDEDSPSTLNASDNIDDTQLCNVDNRSISQYETRVRARERVDSSGRTGRCHYNYYNKTLYKTDSRLLRNEINFLKVDNRNNNNVTVEVEEEILQRTFKHSVSVGDLTTKPSSSSPSLSSLPSLPPPLSLSSLVMNNATLGRMKSTAPYPSASSSHLNISSPGHPLMLKHSVQPKVFADDGTVDDDGAATDEENSGSSASPSSVKTLKYQDNTDHDNDGGAGRAATDIRQLSSSTLSLVHSDGEVAVGGSRSAPGIESSSHFFDIGFIVNDGGETPENLTPTADHHNRRRIPSKVDEEKEEYFDVYEKMHKQRLKEASKIKKTLDVSPAADVNPSTLEHFCDFHAAAIISGGPSLLLKSTQGSVDAVLCHAQD